MVKRPDELRDPTVVPIDDEFNRLPPEEQIRRTAEWVQSLADDEPVDLGVSTAELLAEARAEDGW
jgi:hypothetical protein